MPPIRRRPGRPPGSKNKKKDQQLEIKTENEDVFCKACSKAFETQTELDDHVSLCKKQFLVQNVDIKCKPTYNCNKCNKRFKFKISYAAHLKNEHSTTPGSVPCPRCDVVCPDSDTLSIHIENVHERVEFACEYCDKKFARHSHVLRHMSQKGCDGRDKIIYPCEICNKTFTRKDNLMVHLRHKHLKKQEFTCKHCEYATKNFSKLIRHDQNVHSDTHFFECDHCGKITSSRAAISKHLEIHGEKKFKCDVCGYSSFTIEVMRRHVLTHVLEKPYKCNICNRSYIQKLQLQHHMVKHTGYECSKCSLCFDSKTSFIEHDKEHISSSNLLCPFEGCPHSTKEISSLQEYKAHMNEHLNTKKYNCEVCGKGFKSETYLRRHVSTHALERPRRCMYCVTPRAYVRGEQLVRHVRKCHPAVFAERLKHVRAVLGSNLGFVRVKKSELESILNVLDAESDRILQDYGFGVLYGGLQEQNTTESDEPTMSESAPPIMAEEELAENIKKLLSQLIDHDTLECFGWPNESVDTVLEKVIEQCGARAADREKWSRVQRLRENAKHLFVYAVEDATVARMLHTHTIDQIIAHILAQVSDVTVKSEFSAG